MAEGAALLAESAEIEDAAGAEAWAVRSRLALAGVLADPALSGSPWSRSEVVRRCGDAARALQLVDVCQKLAGIDRGGVGKKSG
jgi:hypothetical protein